MSRLSFIHMGINMRIGGVFLPRRKDFWMKQIGRIWLIVSVFALILHGHGISFAEDVYLETQKGATQKIPITIVLKGEDQALVSTINNVLDADLDRSLFFNLVKNSGIEINDSAAKLDEDGRAKISASGAG